MFDIGFAEIFLLSLIGLLVLGPERLPGVARTVGGFVRKARMSWVSLRRTIEAELAEADIAEPIKKASQDFKQIGKDLADLPGLATDKLDTMMPKLDSNSTETAEIADTAETTEAPDSDSEKTENA